MFMHGCGCFSSSTTSTVFSVRPLMFPEGIFHNRPSLVERMVSQCHGGRFAPRRLALTFAVSPLISMMRAHTHGKFFLHPGCPLGPIHGTVRANILNHAPSLLRAAIFRPWRQTGIPLRYPWRSIAARQEASTEGLSSMANGATAEMSAPLIARLFRKCRGYSYFIGDGTRTTTAAAGPSELFPHRISPPRPHDCP